MEVSVDPDGLAADGARLASEQCAAAPSGCVPPGSDPVSAAVAAQLAAQSAALGALIQHSGVLRADGGVVTQHTAAVLAQTDEANASMFSASEVGGSAVAATPPTVSGSAPSAPVLPEAPGMPAAPSLPGEALSKALHSGPGSAGLRELAATWRATASALEELAGQTESTAKSIDSHWDDGAQPAGANTAEHALWLQQMSVRAVGLAGAAEEAADHFDRAVVTTPRPEEFEQARLDYARAWADNVRAGGLLSAQVSAAAARMAEKQTQATEAGAVYHAAAATTTAEVPKPPSPAPPIARRGNDAGVVLPITRGADPADGDPVYRDGGDALDPATGGEVPDPAVGTGVPVQSPTDPALPNGPAGPPVDPGAAGAVANIAGTIVGAGIGTATQLAPSVMPSGASSLASAPMSALSGLSGLPGLGSPSLPSGGAPSSGTEPSGAEPEPGLGEPEGLDATSPAGGGAGSGGGGGPGGALPPVGSPTPASAVGPVAGGPAVSGGSPVAGGPSGYGGMGMYPPMAGGRGGDDPERRKDLFPDQRVVLRPVPNTEAVFGELESPRRPRPKRAAQEEGDGAGQG